MVWTLALSWWSSILRGSVFERWAVLGLQDLRQAGVDRPLGGDRLLSCSETGHVSRLGENDRKYPVASVQVRCCFTSTETVIIKDFHTDPELYRAEPQFSSRPQRP